MIPVKNIFLLLCLFATFPCRGNNADELFRSANNAYTAGNFSQAVLQYDSLIRSGYESAELFYNLGNACYKANQNARAIIYYERALRLAPADEDIRFNLSLANLRAVDKIESIPALFYQRWWRDLVSLHPSGGWATIAVACAWIACIFFAGFLFLNHLSLRRISFFLFVPLVLLFLFSFWLSVQRKTMETARNEAIVTDGSVYIKGSPDQKGTDLFILHEGVKVRILDAVGEWKKIQLADGKEGWMPAAAAEII